jgi:predicted nuclease of predicted toxin-antitoxin system
MRFLVDECTGPAVAQWLIVQGHEVFSVYDQARGISDEEVLAKAFQERRVLITNDKGFGAKVYRERLPHHGVVLLRLDDERASRKIEVLDQLIKNHAARLADQFVVVTENHARFVNREKGGSI